MTHIIVPKTEDNICSENMECLLGMANGVFIINQNCKYVLSYIIWILSCIVYDFEDFRN